MTADERLTMIKTIRIDGVKTKVNFVEPRRELDDYNAWGTWSPRSNIIEICNIESPQRKMQVLLHEIIHAISYHRCYNAELTETQTQSISSGLLQVLLDNPEVAKLFTDMEAPDA